LKGIRISKELKEHMPAKTTELEQRLWRAADEHRGQLKTEIVGVFRPGPWTDSLAIRRSQVYQGKAHQQERWTPKHWQDNVTWR
jgi:hypothetical protein